MFVSGHNITQVIAETVTQGGLGGEWTRNGLDIYYNGGNVGIGIAAPGARLSVEIGSTTIPSAKFNNLSGGAGSTVHIVESETSSDHFGLFVGDNDTNGAKLTAVLLTKYRNVGIGAINPAGKLHVSDLSESIGNVDVIQGSNQITGTDLNTKLSNGDKIRINTSTFTVSSVTATTLTLSSNWPNATINGVGAFKNKELFIVKNNGNVGIGATNPATSLEVRGPTNSQFRLSRDTNPATQYCEISGGGSSMAFKSVSSTPGNAAHTIFSFVSDDGTNELERMRIDAAGNVGIGTTNPESPLTIKANPAVGSMFKMIDEAAYVQGEARSAISFQGTASDNSRQALGGIEAYGAPDSKGGLRFLCRPLAGTTAVGMVLNEDSNVGIGTTNPGAALDVAGRVHFSKIPCSNNVPGSTFTGAAMSFQPASSNFGTGKPKDIGIGFQSLHSGAGAGETDLLFGTVNPSGGNQEIMKLFSDGRVRIGRNSSENSLAGQQFYGALLPGGSLEIRAEKDLNSATAQLRIVGGSGLNGSQPVTGSLYIDNGGAANTVAKFKISQDITGGEIHVVSSSGGVKLTSGGTTWAPATSDRRAKENISPLENVLEKVLKLSPSRFDFKEEYGNKDQIGFIAQDVNEVLPEFHIPGETEEEMSTVKFSDTATTALLVKAIQEQQQLIEDLKSRIETLENK